MPNRCADGAIIGMSIGGLLATGAPLDVAISGLKTFVKVAIAIGVSVKPIVMAYKRIARINALKGAKAAEKYSRPWSLLYNGFKTLD